MRHTNLSSAVKQAKELAKKNGKAHYANGASGRYKVSDRKPEDSSFVQVTPSGSEWSHKMNQSTKTFTKSRIFGGVTMEDVERNWGISMKNLIEKLEGSNLSEANGAGARDEVIEKLKSLGVEVDPKQPHNHMIYLGGPFRAMGVELEVNNGLWIKFGRKFPMKSDQKRLSRVLLALAKAF